MGNRWITNRERELTAALDERDVEALFWWIVREHKGALLKGERSPLAPGLFRLALVHLSKMESKRTPDSPDEAGDVRELERLLRVVD